MIELLKSIFFRKREGAPVEPSGETILFNAYCTRVQIPKPQFAHKLVARRDLGDPDLIEHLAGFSAFVFSRGDAQMSQDKYHVILHLQRVQHQVSIRIGAADVDALYAWAGEANAILFTQEGHIVDPQGRILVGATDGKADPEARLPYPAQALARMAATQAALAARGVDIPDTLPPLVCEEELVLRSRDEVVDRARALLLVALRADSAASGEPLSSETLLGKMPLAEDGLSPKERAFLDLPAPTMQECAQFTWRYEALYLLEWTLGLCDVLPYPDAPCDAASTVATLIEMRGPELRPAGEILDALDLHYRLHWHIRQMRLKNQGEAVSLDADIVRERHQTLNWLVQFQYASWDEVDTPT